MAASVPGPTGPGTAGSAGITGVTGITGLTGAGLDQDILNFFATLESPALSIEAPISVAEANQAITLFSVVNVLLGGSSQYKVGNQMKTDVLGVLTLFYGLQDRTFPPKIVVPTANLWTSPVVQLGISIQDELKDLRDRLEILGADVDFLKKEAKRQFNLGPPIAEVVGHTEFPKLFKRYVDITNDPLLTLNLLQEESNQFSDKQQIAQAFDLLVELKGVILQIVRSLSKNGTVATEKANQEWAAYENEAFLVLETVAAQRVSDYDDDKRVLAVLADLTDKDFSTRIAPYIALARDGGRLLQLAMVTYNNDTDLDNYERSYLLGLFQNGTIDTFLTTLMRKEALVIKKYPLTTWMG
jgi:hypothetical protein